MHRRHFCTWLAAAPLWGCSTPTPPGGLLGDPLGEGAFRLHAQLNAWRQPSLGPRLFYIGAALNSREPVFHRDVVVLASAMARRAGASLRPLLLSNQRIMQGPRPWPLATPEHLQLVLQQLAQVLQPHDRVVVALSSHGVPGGLEVEQPARYKEPRWLLYSDLAHWLHGLAPHPVLLLLSACHAGSALPSLSQANLITLAASAADRSSFGCSVAQEHTWFMQAWLQAMARNPADQTLQTLWNQTLDEISRLEAARTTQASRPQMQVGSDVAWRLNQAL